MKALELGSGGRATETVLPALMLVMIVVLAACGGGARSPACAGYDALRDAILAVEAAQSADHSGDRVVVSRQMREVDRLIRVARRDLARAAVNSDSGGAAARAILEAANYLEFMVGDFRASGTVDFALTQFAARELNRAASGAGGTPLNC